MTKPLFWNPTKYNDPDVAVQGELWDWVRINYSTNDIKIIQDMCGSMGYFIDRKNVSAPWVWSSKFRPEISSSPAKTLIIIETLGVLQDPHPRYTPELMSALKSFKVLKKSSAKWPYGWLIFEKP